jgi:hypothetical protein
MGDWGRRLKKNTHTLALIFHNRSEIWIKDAVVFQNLRALENDARHLVSALSLPAHASPKGIGYRPCIKLVRGALMPTAHCLAGRVGPVFSFQSPIGQSYT